MTTVTKTTRTVRKPQKRWPWVVSGLLLLGGIGGGLYLRGKGTQTESQTVTTTTERVQRGVLRISVSGPGTLEAAATRTVGADLTATVGAVPAVGERVEKGQLITTLQSPDVEDKVGTARLNLEKAQAALDAARASQTSSAANRSSAVTQAEGTLAQAQATLATAQRTLNGQQELFAIGAVSQQDLNAARDDVAKAQLSVQNAQSSLNAARTQLETGSDNDSQSLRSQQIAVEQAKSDLKAAEESRTALKVYAPISGVVSTVTASEGTVVTSGATILTLIDDTKLSLPVQIDETEIGGVKVGQEAQVTLDAYPEDTFRGKVVRVAPGATQNNGISVFTATVELANAGGQLRSGMTAEAEIVQSEERGLLVPSKAIETVRSRSYVTLASEASEPERVRVTTGASDGTNTVVTDGLQEGQEVVVPGAARRTGSGDAASPASGNRGQGQRGMGGLPAGGFGGRP